MKSSCISILSILVVLGCNAQQELQGLWNSSWVENSAAPPNADAAFNSIYHNSDIYLEGDGLWNLEYPCKKISVETYSPESFQWINDSTFNYRGERYSRQNYEPLAISTLKAHDFNSECYAGKWNLIRSESGGDGTGIVFIYPFEIDDTLVLANDALNGNVLKLRIEGVERDFHFSLERDVFEYQLILTPTDSWKEKDKIMWTRYWDLPPAGRKELNKIKQEEGIGLELLFNRI